MPPDGRPDGALPPTGGDPVRGAEQADTATAPYDRAVIEVSRCTPAGVDAVWAVLADGFRYAAWVVGAARVRAVDDGWPAAGTRIHHSVGTWPAMLDDVTTVLSSVPARELVMQARGWPAGEARVELELLPGEQAGGCRILMREDATHGPGRLIPGPLRQWAIAPRNAESLRRLAYLAERPRG